LPRINVVRSGVEAVPVVRKMERRFGIAAASSALISAVGVSEETGDRGWWSRGPAASGACPSGVGGEKGG
jgi:hypothetical protein